MSGGEGVGRSDRRLADAIAKRGGKRMQGAPAGAMAGDDVGNREWPQPLDSVGDDPLHDPAEVQAAHHAMDRDLGKQMPHLGADIDDAGMRTRAEHDQSQILDMGHQHALVEQQRVGFPRGVRSGPAQMIGATLFKSAPPRDFAAIVKVIVEQQARGRIVDDLRTQGRHFVR